MAAAPRRTAVAARGGGVVAARGTVQRRLNSAASVTMALLSLLQEGSLQHAFEGTLSSSRLHNGRNIGNSVWFPFFNLFGQSTDCCCLFDLEFRHFGRLAFSFA